MRLISYDEATGNDPGVATTDDVAKVAAAADTFPGTSFDVDLASSRAAPLDLTDLARSDDAFDRDDFYAGMLSQVERANRLLGLPHSANLGLVYYDPAVLAEVGAVSLGVGWTWDDLLAAAALATGTGSDGTPRYGFIDRDLADTLTALAHGMARSLTEAREDGDALHLAEPAVAEALRWYTALHEEHGVIPALGSEDRQDLDDLVYGGRPCRPGSRSSWTPSPAYVMPRSRLCREAQPPPGARSTSSVPARLTPRRPGSG